MKNVKQFNKSLKHHKVYARKGDEDMVFSSVNEAATYVNGKANRIYKCCEGVLKYHRGWQFSYKPLPPSIL